MMQKQMSVAVAMCLSMGLLVMGCGGTDSDGQNTAAVGGSPDKPVVKVGWLPTDHDAPLFVAQAKGYYANYGVNVEIIKYAGGAPLAAAIAAGTMDVGVVGIPPAILTKKANPNAGLTMVASVHNNGSGLFVKKGLGITRFTDLKGKIVAIPGANSIQEFLLKQLCLENGMLYNADPVTGQPADIQHPVVAAGAQIAAMQAGTIDAAISWEPFVTMASMQNVADVLLTSEQIRPGHPCDVILTNGDMMQNYPHSIKQFLKAHKKAIQFINSDLAAAAQITSDPAWMNDDPAVEQVALTHMTFMYYPDEGFLAGTERMALELGTTYNRNDLFDLSLEPPQTP
jgi:NitT/TauT family transport system substrate-binding protein